MENLIHILVKAHSGIRYLLLLFLVLALVAAFIGWFSKGAFTKSNRILNVFTVIFAHTQALIGLILYFISPKGIGSGNSFMKFEHIGAMLLAVVFITLGNTKSKKGVTTAAKHRGTAIYFGIALLLIVVTILRMVQLQLLPSFFGAN